MRRTHISCMLLLLKLCGAGTLGMNSRGIDLILIIYPGLRIKTV